MARTPTDLADVRLVAYVTPAEHDRFVAAAEADGRSLSRWIRRTLGFEVVRCNLGSDTDDDPVDDDPVPVAVVDESDVTYDVTHSEPETARSLQDNGPAWLRGGA